MASRLSVADIETSSTREMFKSRTIHEIRQKEILVSETINKEIGIGFCTSSLFQLSAATTFGMDMGIMKCELHGFLFGKDYGNVIDTQCHLQT